MTKPRTIVFVCEHGAAKSVIAAAYFNKLAAEAGVKLRAIARGINPDDELSANTIEGLRADGVISTESAPQKLSQADAESAQRVVSFCALPEEYVQKAVVEQWDGIPPVSDNYAKARDAILERLESLMKNLR